MDRFVLAAATAIFTAACAQAQPRWDVVNLHPSGATSSRITGVSDMQQTGYAYFDSGLSSRAMLWTGTASSATDLTPTGAGFFGAVANAVDGGQEAGYSYVVNHIHAALWNSTAASWVDLHPAAASDSAVQAVRDGQEAGYVQIGGVTHAAMWSGSAGSWVDLHPTSSGATQSALSGIDGSHQAGSVRISGFDHASMWGGTPNSWVDLHPQGMAQSEISAAHGGQQAGYGFPQAGGLHALVWSGTASSVIDLHPVTASQSACSSTYFHWQAGYARISGVDHACVWNTAPASFDDLSLALAQLGGSWGSSSALAIWTDGARIYVGGYGFNNVTGREEALLWSRSIGRWKVTYLHPQGSGNSHAYGVADGLEVGSAEVNGVEQAASWAGTTESYVNVAQNTPLVSYSVAYGVSGTTKAASAIALQFQAVLFQGTGNSCQLLQPAVSNQSAAVGISSSDQVGLARINNRSHAAMWTGTPQSFIDLNPLGVESSVADGTSAGEQVGWAQIGTNAHASLWHGGAQTWVDLNPSGALASEARAVDHGREAGYVQIGSQTRAALWNSTAASFTDLHPSGLDGSTLYAIYNGREAGDIDSPTGHHAATWSGTADSYEDLSEPLGPSWGRTYARGIWDDGTMLYIVGFGESLAQNNTQALLWTRPLCCRADFNCDSVVDLFDYLDFVAAFASSDSGGDFNADGVIDLFDYLDFVQAFAEGCAA